MKSLPCNAKANELDFLFCFGSELVRYHGTFTNYSEGGNLSLILQPWQDQENGILQGS